MRITGGTHRGRLLQSPKTMVIRPTADKIRLAVFNMLEARGLLQDAVILDAFCGTGALGLEGLSRGAAFAIFMDNNKASLALAQKNAAALGLMPQAQFIFSDATKPTQRAENIAPATLVFLDPPYRKGLLPPAITALKAHGYVAQKAMFLLECERDCTPDHSLPRGYEALVIKDYGDTRIVLAQSHSG